MPHDAQTSLTSASLSELRQMIADLAEDVKALQTAFIQRGGILPPPKYRGGGAEVPNPSGGEHEPDQKAGELCV